MSSPAEAHAEFEAEKRQSKKISGATERLKHLQQMQSECGFGNGYSWEELRITEHLESAKRLLELIIK